MAPEAQSSQPWEAKATEKRERCSRAIPEAWKIPSALWDELKMPLEQSKNDLIGLKIVERSKILTPKELQITESYDVPDLLKELATGALTAVEVTTAFSKRAAIAQQLVYRSQ
jgi:amidase